MQGLVVINMLTKIFSAGAGELIKNVGGVIDNLHTSAEEKLERKKENTLCQKCFGSGYKGRVGAYELLIVDRKIQNAISKDSTDREIENLAIEENSMLTLTQYGVELVKENLTTLSEVVRVCKSD